VQNGREAFQEFQKRNQHFSAENIHLIIMDQNMPEMEGNEATKKVSFIHSQDQRVDQKVLILKCGYCRT
jgi:CheY-like chemotaxis protein